MSAGAGGLVINPGLTAAVGSITAATSASRRRRELLQAYYGRGNNPGDPAHDTDNSNSFTSSRTTSYMNHLRGPPSPVRHPAAVGGGDSVHIHYQSHHRHYGSHSESEAYPYLYSQTYSLSPANSEVGYHETPCGCSECYWRDFVSLLTFLSVPSSVFIHPMPRILTEHLPHPSSTATSRSTSSRANSCARPTRGTSASSWRGTGSPPARRRRRRRTRSSRSCTSTTWAACARSTTTTAGTTACCSTTPAC
ncbi:hypothetical protein F4808DRAFT_415797 [Astrocystis sublimbata]|nr:hypothetical protein F4808DRAFT_415797 [Astrocystis sublimbata]